jgi:uncharacterized membrane protein
MAGVVMVAVAAAAFVGTHFAMSHPLRAPLVGRLGERGFLGVYSLVAAATLAWVVLAYRATTPGGPLWPVGDLLWALASAVMLLASILLIGSLVRNPALPTGGGGPTIPDAARGVYAITRHPMMWSIALWGGCHIAVFPTPANIVLSGAIIVLALVGAALQDRKKARLSPGVWTTWEAMTGYWPLAAIASGRARLGGFGLHSLLGGLVVWLAATWAHLPIAGVAAGVWRWLR